MPPSADQLDAFLKSLEMSYVIVSPDQQTQAYVLGKNLRFNLAKAFETAALGVAAGISLLHFLHGKASADDLGGISAGFALWTSLLNTIRLQMTALQYVYCLALATRPDGVHRKDVGPLVKQYIEDHLAMPEGNWLGVSHAQLKDAQIELDAIDHPDEFLAGEKMRLWVQEKSGLWFVRERHFTIGFDER